MDDMNLYKIDVYTIALDPDSDSKSRNRYLVLADSEDAARGILESREPPTTDQPVEIEEVEESKNPDSLVRVYNLSETNPFVRIGEDF